MTKSSTKKRTSARTLCRKVIDVPGINKRTGQLLKGWHYVNGKPVKATKKTTNKKGLRNPDVRTLCEHQNADGSRTYYSSIDGTCKGRGDKLVTKDFTKKTTLNGVAKSKTNKKPTAKQLQAQKAFAAKAKQARKLVETGKARTLKSAWKMIK